MDGWMDGRTNLKRIMADGLKGGKEGRGKGGIIGRGSILGRFDDAPRLLGRQG